MPEYLVTIKMPWRITAHNQERAEEWGEIIADKLATAACHMGINAVWFGDMKMIQTEIKEL